MPYTHDQLRVFGVLALASVVGCVFEPPVSSVADLGLATDAARDSGADAAPDSGADASGDGGTDGGIPDAELPDGGRPEDGGDGDVGLDATAPDAAPDAGPDASSLDATPLDATPLDAAPPDAGVRDATPVDATPVDTGVRDATPLDATPVDTGLRDAAPVDAAPVDAAPVDAAPVDAAADAGPPDTGAEDAGCVSRGTTSDRSFDAKDNFAAIDFGNDVAFNLVGEFTIAFWIKIRDADRGATTILSRVKTTAQNDLDDGWVVRFIPTGPNDGRFRLELLDGGVVLGGVNADVENFENEWVHVAFEGYVGAANRELASYVDGVFQASSLMLLPDWSPMTRAPLLVPPHAGMTNRTRFRLTDLHVAERALFGTDFDPADQNPALPETGTLGLWWMDEPDLSTVAHEAECRHPGAVSPGANYFNADRP